MREILFRGKRVDNCEWIVGHLLRYEDGRARIIESHTDIFCYEKDESIIQTVAHKVYPQTVGQFTGMTDKNGKKIFEGDIVEVNHDACPGARGEVFFRNGSFMLEKVSDVLSLYGFLPWCEVIGNIHDNPELLEG